MTYVQILEAFIGFCGVIIGSLFTFLVYRLYKTIEEINLNLTSRLDKVESAVDERLTRFEDKLSEIVTEVATAVTKQDTDSQEIEKLRQGMHDLREKVQVVSLIQQRCKTCNPSR